MAQANRQRFRVVGSGYTFFSYAGSKIKFCEMIQDQSPAPVAPPEPVQPLDARHPIEIAFPRAAGAGTLVLQIKEEWDRDVWRQFKGYGTGVINDIVDLFDTTATVGGVACAKLIVPPLGHKPRAVIYHNCVIVDADFGEQVAINSMTVNKSVTIMYTHTTRKDSLSRASLDKFA